MEAQCIDIERIGSVLDLAEDHPTRRHTRDCPRCRSLLVSYQTFLRAEPTEGSGIERGRASLDATIRARAGRFAEAGTRSRTTPERGGFFRMMLRPAPLVAAGAVVILAAALLWPRGDGAPVLRNGNTVDAHGFVTDAPQSRADGSVQLSWSPVEGADHYEVRLYSGDLAEVYRHPAVTGTSVTIDRAALPPALASGTDLTWRVVALQGGDVIGTSTPRSLRVP